MADTGVMVASRLSRMAHCQARAAAVAVLVPMLLAVAGAPASATTNPSPPGATVAAQALDRARGLNFDGLRRGRSDGPCARKYEMVLSSGEVLCTHGPDAAPAGVDVSEPAPVPMVPQEGPVTALSTVSCEGDGTSGNRVQLVYARAAGVADRYATMLPSFRQWAARIDDMVNASAAETGGSRHVRYVHNANCEPTVLNVTLTAAGDDTLGSTIDELRAQGHNRSDRKYLVWVDANVYCGIAQVYNDDRPGQENYNNGPSSIAGMVARVDTGCWGSTNLVEAHELFHTLGSVQPGAPNATPGGHCTDENDRMCYSDAQGVTTRLVCPSTGAESRLDCNHDDYFSTNPPAGSWLATHWNTADSSFLAKGGAAPSPPPAATRNDFDGNGTTDVAVYRPSAGHWYVKDGNPGLHVWGASGDLNVPADYTGDGKVDVAIYRPSTGQWFLKDVPSGFAAWGQKGDIPVPADYDGNGTANLAVFRPSTGEWFIKDVAAGYATWGQDGDIPVPADYDGNGSAEIAVFRPSNGGWYVKGGVSVTWGAKGDVPLPGDYDGDGDAEAAVFRPSNGAWYVHGTAGVTWWGAKGDVPVPGDYDGNGTLDKAVFRSSNGTWYVHGSSAPPAVWGGSQDLPTVVSNTVFGLLGLLDLIL